MKNLYVMMVLPTLNFAWLEDGDVKTLISPNSFKPGMVF